MKKSIVLLFFLTIIIQSPILFAQDLATLNIQGVVRDNFGGAVTDGDYSFIFRIYENEGDPISSKLWEETQTLTVQNGVYTADLGTINPFTGLGFDKPYYVGVTFSNGDEILPRIRLTAAPYALSLQGVDNVFPSSGNVGIGTSGPGQKLTVDGNASLDGLLFNGSSYNLIRGFTSQYETGLTFGTRYPLIFQTATTGAFEFITHNGTNLFAIRGIDGTASFNGNVGVGTSSPKSKLSVYGSVGSAPLNAALFQIGGSNYSSTYKQFVKMGAYDSGSDNGSYGWLQSYRETSAASPQGVYTPFVINKDGGNVGIGDATPSSKLDVNGTVNADNLTIDGAKPFKFKVYDFGTGSSSAESVNYTTTYSTSSWAAAIIGFDAGLGALDEDDNETLWEVRILPNSDGFWHIYLQSPTEGYYPDWKIYVMYIQKELVDFEGYTF